MGSSPRQPRLSSAVRGWIIAAFVAAYGWFFQQPGASLSSLLLVGAALQIVVIALRRFIPDANQHEAMQLVEMLADGATVLCFALGIFGGIAAQTAQV